MQRTTGENMQIPRSMVQFSMLVGALGSLWIPTAGARQLAAPGETKQTAIEVCKPSGQREYLARLMCSGGETPTFSRLGSYGMRDELPGYTSENTSVDEMKRAMSFAPHPPGTRHFHAVDRYELTCGSQKHLVFMDMYHCGVPAPEVAPAGLTLRPKP
jgi:hypothetical protein